jgi:hypothetical protein
VTRIRSADRLLLEETLLGAYAADASLRTLLFVGCDWYTQGYAGRFAPRDWLSVLAELGHSRFKVRHLLFHVSS